MSNAQGSDRVPDTHSKALKINLDNRRYGTFAEIGAGQEVVRWFFRVGGAAGTIAKSMSAYDMEVSDAIYGKAERYVCRPRLQRMLDYEYDLNLSRLLETRGSSTAFFAFADTVSARNYKGTNECHGWMGVKFQSHPRDQFSQIIIHVRMLDSENALQQEALGIVGVNLLFGAFFLFHAPEQLIESLLDGLTTQRIEIDMIEFSGIEFRLVDNRLMGMKLVQIGLSGVTMFAPDGAVLQPSEALHKKNVLVERGSFRPVCHANTDMLRCARMSFDRDLGPEAGPTIELMELTMRDLREEGGEVDRADFLARADMLAACGKTVIISDYFEYYRLAGYLFSYTKKNIAITMGASSLADLLDEKYYTTLPGGILESLGRLFKNDLRLYIYPFVEPGTNEMVTVETLKVAPRLQKLYGYLVDSGYVRQLEGANRDYLQIFSRDALRKIKEGDPTWESMVPLEVATLIKERRLLGYRPSRV
ncbi:MAG: TonB-dependent receptor [Deltaproteobacteria bacterium]|nr:TonB-dependent receptor [Deltaproteobacteria bacterium]